MTAGQPLCWAPQGEAMDASSSLIAQAITVIGALGGVLVGTFGGESYRRFGEAKALAAAFLGELSSLKLALELLSRAIDTQLAALDGDTLIPSIKPPSKPPSVFEANLQRIGMLGAEITKGLAFTYHMVNTADAAARAALTSDDVVMKRVTLQISKSMIVEAQRVMPGVLESLDAWSSRRWLKVFP